MICVTVIGPDSVLTVLWTVMGWPPAVAAAAAEAAAACCCNISSFFILAANIFAARFGVGWLAEIETVGGLETNDVSRETNFVVVDFCVSVLILPLEVEIVTDCVLII